MRSRPDRNQEPLLCLSQLAEQRSASSLCHQLFYKEALQLAEDGSVSCRVLRWETPPPTCNGTMLCGTGPLLLGEQTGLKPRLYIPLWRGYLPSYDNWPHLNVTEHWENVMGECLNCQCPMHSTLEQPFICMRVDTMFPQLSSKAIAWLLFPRTELLECLGDTDFLAKLHCVRQACQVYHAHWAFALTSVPIHRNPSVLMCFLSSPAYFEWQDNENISGGHRQENTVFDHCQSTEGRT